MDMANFDRPQRRTTTLITREILRYGINIAALAETRLADVGSVEEIGSGYIVFQTKTGAYMVLG